MQKQKIKMKEFYVVFRFQECPSGQFQYSKIVAQNKRDAEVIMAQKYGEYAPIKLLSYAMFKRNPVYKLGATQFELLMQILEIKQTKPEQTAEPTKKQIKWQVA